METEEHGTDSHHLTDTDEEGEAQADLIEVSNKTYKLLSNMCTQSVSNETRRRVRNRYSLPIVTATKSPNLDAFMRTEISSSTKTSDKELAKIQKFVLDSLAPLTALLENAEKMNPIHIHDAAASAVELVGNASAQLSQLRREKIITGMNKTLLPLSKEDANFVEAPPNLFGSEFTKWSKEYMEQVKALCSTLPPRDMSRIEVFSMGPPSKRVRQRPG